MTKEIRDRMNEALEELEPKAFNRLDKNERIDTVYKYVPDIFEWFVTYGHKHQETMKKLISVLNTPKVAKAFKRIVKDSFEYDDVEPLGVQFATILNEVITRGENIEDEVFDTYSKVIMTILKGEIKALTKATGISNALALNLLVILPSPDVIANQRVVGIYVNKIARKLYALADRSEPELINNVKQLRKVFKFLFGKEYLPEVYVSILLERKYHGEQSDNVKALHIMLSNMAMTGLEALDKKELRDALINYANRRAHDDKNKRDAARRVQFNTYSADDYPRTLKTIKKLTKKEENYSKYLI